jgi:hypothetical protein
MFHRVPRLVWGVFQERNLNPEGLEWDLDAGQTQNTTVNLQDRFVVVEILKQRPVEKQT